MYRGDADEHRNLATIRPPHEQLLSLELLSPQHPASWPLFPWQRFSIGSADLSSIVIERGNGRLAHDLERTAVCDDSFGSCLDKMDAVGGILHDGAEPCSLPVQLIPQLTLVNSCSRMRGEKPNRTLVFDGELRRAKLVCEVQISDAAALMTNRHNEED